MNRGFARLMDLQSDMSRADNALVVRPSCLPCFEFSTSSTEKLVLPACGWCWPTEAIEKQCSMFYNSPKKGCMETSS